MDRKDTPRSRLVEKRLRLAAMFYPIERKLERRWAKLFLAGFAETARELEIMAEAQGYRQQTQEDRIVFWHDPETGSHEAMFFFIYDIMDLASVQRCFREIERNKVFMTYAVVHQIKDGPGDFDIFRFSPFSYLEHCNRVRYPLRK